MRARPSASSRSAVSTRPGPPVKATMPSACAGAAPARFARCTNQAKPPAQASTRIASSRPAASRRSSQVVSWQPAQPAAHGALRGEEADRGGGERAAPAAPATAPAARPRAPPCRARRPRCNPANGAARLASSSRTGNAATRADQAAGAPPATSRGRRSGRRCSCRSRPGRARSRSPPAAPTGRRAWPPR